MSNEVTTMTVAAICRQIAVTAGVSRLQELAESGSLDADTLTAILDEAANFASKVLAPINVSLDRSGCRLDGGRVSTAPGHQEAWSAYIRDGWPTLDQPIGFGGQELPGIVMTACQELFERENTAFGMLPTAQRAAATLLMRHAAPEVVNEWLPHLVRGEWGATICISESGAGSDVLRIRTSAEQTAGGQWLISGGKNWISFGDHDLTERIGHCVLARSPNQSDKASGISLFLIPNAYRNTDGTGHPNGVRVTRLENKLGLHGSPTCAVEFDRSRGILIGELGRGLAQIFTMIVKMRLSVAVQGLGIACRATELAVRYAFERHQGGPPGSPPVPISEHLDVQRMLMGMISRATTLRGLVFALSVQMDLAEREPMEDARLDAVAFSQWLLPIAKTTAAEAAFEIASEAVQVYGGAGYVKDFPVEQLLRDSRVFAVYEGTSGMQALDLFRRRLLLPGGRRGLEVFQKIASEELRRAAPGPLARALEATLDRFNSAAAMLTTPGLEHSEAAATAFLQLAGHAAMSWVAMRTCNESNNGDLVTPARYWLLRAASKAGYLRAQIEETINCAGLFGQLFPELHGAQESSSYSKSTV
jgi:3-(methylthio)propanoyl-CoA dehydrogenase